MTIYNTYQEAKIANPDSHIITRNSCEFHAVKNSLATHISDGWDLCNPADFCVTIEKFLRDGNRFVDGDFYLNSNGDLRQCNRNFPPSLLNKASDGDFYRYVLRAESLDIKEKPKRAKFEYEQVEFSEAWEPVKAYCDGQDLYCGAGVKVVDPEISLKLWVHGNLYRKVERPIEWWEDAADFIKDNSFNIGKQARKVGDGAFYVDSKMTREQWCDFARILLEQEEE